MVHICHKWSKNPKGFKRQKFNIANVAYVIPNFNMFSHKRYRQLEHVANGNIAIRKKIYDNINWYRDRPRKQDIDTNIDISKKYKNLTLFIREELYLYQGDNSSYKYTKKYTPIKVASDKTNIVAEPVIEPATKSTNLNTVSESTIIPISEPIKKPIAEPIAEPIMEPTTDTKEELVEGPSLI